jgi:FKBP-type peptidyl-prolyl cis-trans isomerase 2
MSQIKKGDTVRVHYHGKLTDGTTFDSSAGREPLEFEVGAGMMIKGFDDGVLDMKVGEKKTISVPAEDAYGPSDPENIIEFPIANFPADMKPEVGMQLNMRDNSGGNFPVVIAAVKEEHVLLDANHPLAGKELIFDIEIVDVKPAPSRIIMP